MKNIYKQTNMQFAVEEEERCVVVVGLEYADEVCHVSALRLASGLGLSR